MLDCPTLTIGELISSPNVAELSLSRLDRF